MKIGVQMYTVRDYCKTLEDFADTLKKIADIGYTTVQVSGTCAYEPQWLKSELGKNGLSCVITHTPVDKMCDNPKQVCDNHTVFDCRHIGIGSYQFTPETAGEDYAGFVEKFTPVSKVMRENGKYLMYHNHDMEFIKIGGETILGKMAEDFPPDLLGFTLDTFWVQAGGGDPAAWIERLSGRLPCIHLKDFAFGRKMMVIGEGNINFDRVFPAAEKAGTRFMLVEQDDCNGEDPFECLTRSYNYLASLGFK